MGGEFWGQLEEGVRLEEGVKLELIGVDEGGGVIVVFFVDVAVVTPVIHKLRPILRLTYLRSSISQLRDGVTIEIMVWTLFFAN